MTQDQAAQLMRKINAIWGLRMTNATAEEWQRALAGYDYQVVFKFVDQLSRSSTEAPKLPDIASHCHRQSLPTGHKVDWKDPGAMVVQSWIDKCRDTLAMASRERSEAS